MKNSTNVHTPAFKQRILNTLLLTVFLIFGYGLQAQIEFPVKVGVKPESITKGFNGNYYVTLMNGKESGDGELVEISKNGVKVFAKGFDEPKGIAYIGNHLYFSDLTRVWKVDKKGNASVFLKKEDFPEEVLYLNDVAVDAEGKGIYIADMGAKTMTFGPLTVNRLNWCHNLAEYIMQT